MTERKELSGQTVVKEQQHLCDVRFCVLAEGTLKGTCSAMLRYIFPDLSKDPSALEAPVAM